MFHRARSSSTSGGGAGDGAWAISAPFIFALGRAPLAPRVKWAEIEQCQPPCVVLIVEADGTESLSRGMQGLGVSMAKRINLVSQRSGAVVEERFFSRPLRTPREVANAVRYLLRNEARHLSRAGIVAAGEWGFTSSTARPADPPLTRPPRTWMLATLLID